MHVECAPPFGLEVGVVLRKRNEIEKYVKNVSKKMIETYVCLGFGLEKCSENGKRSDQ